MSAVIELNKVSKRYKGAETRALRNLTLKIEEGEIYGLLGPNGAGKTTTLRMLMGFIAPTGGSYKILGKNRDFNSVLVKNNIGYLSSDIQIYPKMTGRQFFDYMSSLKQLEDKKYLRELVKKFQINLDKKISDLSRGNKQKIAIAQALMHKPKVLILDEPTSGLDPLMQETFYAELKALQKNGTTTLFSSHILAEVQKVCDRVGIIRSGQLVDERNIADLVQDAGQKFDVVFEGKPAIGLFKKIPGVEIIENSKDTIVFKVTGPVNELLKELSRHKIKSLKTEVLDLEDVFMGYYSGGGKT